MLSRDVPLSVRVQNVMGQLFYIPLMWWVPLGFFLIGLRVKELKKLRAYYKEITDEKYPPLVICPNHLTYVDSIILITTFANHFWYPFHFRRHMWNLAAKEYAKNPIFLFVCYFSKVLFISRENEKNNDYPTLKTAIKLLRCGHIVLVFPEGRRSKTGRFDDSKLAYGVGKIISEIGECRVLCTYLRCPELGEKARGLPALGSKYTILTELVHYNKKSWGSHPAAGITRDVADRIKKLETKYFETLRNTH